MCLNKIKINIFLLSLIFAQAAFAAFSSNYEIKGDDIYNLTIQDVHFIKGNNKIRIEKSYQKANFFHSPGFTIIKDAADSSTDADYAVFYIKIGYDDQNYCELDNLIVDKNGYSSFINWPKCQGNIACVGMQQEREFPIPMLRALDSIPILGPLFNEPEYYLIFAKSHQK